MSEFKCESRCRQGYGYDHEPWQQEHGLQRHEWSIESTSIPQFEGAIGNQQKEPPQVES